MPDWMAFNVADYVANTLHLTARQHGGYILLICAAWGNKGILPGSDAALMAIAKLSGKEWKQDGEVLKAFLTRRGDGWVHERVEFEWNDAQGLISKKSKAGVEGGRARWKGRSAGTTRSERLAAARILGSHTSEEWASLLDALGHTCVRCRTSAADLDGGKLCKDHIKPIYQGGDDSIENLQPMCRNCNSSKGPEAFDYRQNVRQDWRKRLAECLAKRQANASQTPAPIPSPLPDDSEPTGSGANAPSAKDLIFSECLPWANERQGTDCRSLIAKLMHAVGDDEALRLLRQCREGNEIDPKSWISARLKPAPTENWNDRRIRETREALR